MLPYPGEGEQWEVEFHLRGRDLTDDGLAHVAALKNVVALNLRDTQFTSAGLVHLRGLTKLRRLHLVNLPDLEYLNLYATKITDKSLDQLAGRRCCFRAASWRPACRWCRRCVRRATSPVAAAITGTHTAAISRK